MDDRFEFNGIELPIFDHEYNTTVLNERAVEIPITMWWLAEHSIGRGLEVGNVLEHYFPALIPRRVVDAYEEAEGVENLDVFEIKGEYDFIFAISTLEHVRWDAPEERELDGAAQAMTHLYQCLAPGGKMLITIPFGSNPGLDYAILSGEWGPGWLKRQTVMMRSGGLWYETVATGRWECKGSSWHQAESIWWERYGKSTPWADAIWIGEFEK
jgi:hypothetical protein